MLLKIAILFSSFLQLIQIGHASSAFELDNPIVVTDPYTGKTALNWNIRKQPNAQGPMPKGKHFNFITTNHLSTNRIQLPINATHCSTIGLRNLKGYCLEIADSIVPDSIEISIVFENGIETYLGRISFDKWHNKIGKPHPHGHENKTIEEMFHAVQSEIFLTFIFNSHLLKMDSKQMVEMLHKFEAELLQKNKEAISNQIPGAMFHMGIKVGAKFWDLNKEMAKIKEEMATKFGNENDRLMEEMAQLKNGIAKMKKGVAKSTAEFAKENCHLKAEMTKKDEEIIGMKEEIAGQKGQIAKLEDNNRAMKRKMDRILFCIPNAKKFFIRRALPAELINEIFASLPLKNASGLLAKMPNGHLARNVRKMLKSAVKNNKLNAADCGPQLVISQRGLVVNDIGPYEGWTCVRAVSPFPPFNLTANAKSIGVYFEAQKSSKRRGGISIGFSTQAYGGKSLGQWEYSIEIFRKKGMLIDGKDKKFKNGVRRGFFKIGDVIGIGIAAINSLGNSPAALKCFASCNGKLLGTIELATKFADMELFPTVSLFEKGDSAVVNFGQEKFVLESMNK